MRFLLIFFLSLCLTLNAAYAAVTDICDAAETGQNSTVVITASTHTEHFGHHSHDADHVADVGAESKSSGADTQLPHGDHCHPHQCFTSVLPGALSLPTALGRDASPESAHDRFVSAQLTRLERPPRAALA